MSTAMYDAREALIPGSAYDRSNAGIYVLFIKDFIDCIYSPEKNRPCLGFVFFKKQT